MRMEANITAHDRAKCMCIDGAAGEKPWSMQQQQPPSEQISRSSTLPPSSCKGALAARVQAGGM